MLGNGLTYSGLQIGPISSGAGPARTSNGSSFTTDATGTSSSSVSLQVGDPSAGTLAFSLYNSATGAATEQTVSSSGTGTATLSLNNLPAGEYFVGVSPASLSAVTGYQLVFDPPTQ